MSSEHCRTRGVVNKRGGGKARGRGPFLFLCHCFILGTSQAVEILIDGGDADRLSSWR